MDAAPARSSSGFFRRTANHADSRRDRLGFSAAGTGDRLQFLRLLRAELRPILWDISVVRSFELKISWSHSRAGRHSLGGVFLDLLLARHRVALKITHKAGLSAIAAKEHDLIRRLSILGVGRDVGVIVGKPGFSVVGGEKVLIGIASTHNSLDSGGVAADELP